LKPNIIAAILKILDDYYNFFEQIYLKI